MSDIPTSFSQHVASFYDQLDSLTSNDAQKIDTLTALAKQAEPCDVEIIASCVSFRIIMNTLEHKLPVVRLLDSIARNCGPSYVGEFSSTIGELLPAVCDLIQTPEGRRPYLEVVRDWVASKTFNSTLLQTILDSLQKTDVRRSQLPYPSGWPAQIPPSSASYPVVELSIVKYFYRTIASSTHPTQEELTFTKDSLATLVKLLLALNATLCLSQDYNLELFLADYEAIAQHRQNLLREGHTAPISETMTQQPQPPLIPHNVDSSLLEAHQGDAMVNRVAHEPTVAQPSISDPHTLLSYCQENIDLLYTRLRYQCKTCGLRFKADRLWKDHLEMHYFERGVNLAGLNSKPKRQWYSEVTNWMETNGGTAARRELDAQTSNGAKSVQSERAIASIRASDSVSTLQSRACGDKYEPPPFAVGPRPLDNAGDLEIGLDGYTDLDRPRRTETEE